VQWYLERDSYSYCVKIRCQKMDREKVCRGIAIVGIFCLAMTCVSRRWRRYLCVIITAILKSVIINCSFDLWISNKPIHHVMQSLTYFSANISILLRVLVTNNAGLDWYRVHYRPICEFLYKGEWMKAAYLEQSICICLEGWRKTMNPAAHDNRASQSITEVDTSKMIIT
jgi:hypothetical protein